jgi:hypothetical protein
MKNDVFVKIFDKYLSDYIIIVTDKEEIMNNFIKKSNYINKTLS